MTMRTIAIAALSLLMTSCVLFEVDSGPPERDCGKKGASPDDGPCRCKSDCQPSSGGTTCLREQIYGYPGGICVHRCSDDAECAEGYICHGESCTRVCETNADCEAGRICLLSILKPRVSLCWGHCDEDADCEYGACDLYSGDCVEPGKEARGAGLNAPCIEDADCRSGSCVQDMCSTPCDPAFQHCPEGGLCVAGWCENSCTMRDDCSAGQSCVDAEAGQFCSAEG